MNYWSSIYLNIELYRIVYIVLYVSLQFKGSRKMFFVIKPLFCSEHLWASIGQKMNFSTFSYLWGWGNIFSYSIKVLHYFLICVMSLSTGPPGLYENGVSALKCNE